jgi:LuxR family maltose regulon positive regulatory protein
VLDDYHVITDTVVHETVSLLVERLPEHVHVVVATRRNPPTPASASSARQASCRSCGPNDLAFDARRGHPGAHPAFPESISARTRWTASPGAPRAGRQGSRSPRVPRRARRRRQCLRRGVHRHRPVTSWTTSARRCSAGLPPDLREFVLRTSILRRLSPESCRAVTGRPERRSPPRPRGARRRLPQRDRPRAAVVPLPPACSANCSVTSWPSRSRTSCPPCHRRAAAWSTATGAIGDAVAHHVAAGDAGQPRSSSPSPGRSGSTPGA